MLMPNRAEDVQLRWRLFEHYCSDQDYQSDVAYRLLSRLCPDVMKPWSWSWGGERYCTFIHAATLSLVRKVAS